MVASGGTFSGETTLVHQCHWGGGVVYGNKFTARVLVEAHSGQWVISPAY